MKRYLILILSLAVLSSFTVFAKGKGHSKGKSNHASKHAIQTISLMVSKDNYAINLYKQQSFQKYADNNETDRSYGSV